MSVSDLVKIRWMTETGTARAIRVNAGLSLSEIARDADVDRTTVHRWETGRRRPRGEAALRYLHVLEELGR
jgi:DNA-binding transcriptional regulator YiaG